MGITRTPYKLKADTDPQDQYSSNDNQDQSSKKLAEVHSRLRNARGVTGTQAALRPVVSVLVNANEVSITSTDTHTRSDLRSSININNNTLTPARDPRSTGSKKEPGSNPQDQKALETRKTRHNELVEKARRIALGQEKRKAVIEDQDLLVKVREMAYTYETALGEYLHRPTLRFVKGAISTEYKSFEQFKRAALIADQLGCGYEVYVKAQFYWFDQWFKRAPKPYELSGLKTKFPAPERVREYMKLLNAGQVREVIRHISKRVKIDEKELMKANDQKLQQLMSAWHSSEEQILLKFARPGVAYFDHAWLKKNRTWLRLRKEGRL